MFDERGDAVVLLAIEIGVFEEVEISRAADLSDLADNVKGFLIEFLELVAAVFRTHGANYINLMRALNSTLVLRDAGACLELKITLRD
jgi:hypothetical protein